MKEVNKSEGNEREREKEEEEGKTKESVNQFCKNVYVCYSL